MLSKNGLAIFIPFYLRGFAEYTYPQYENSQEFALDGGVIFDTLANNNSLMQMESSFQHYSAQYEFVF